MARTSRLVMCANTLRNMIERYAQKIKSTDRGRHALKRKLNWDLLRLLEIGEVSEELEHMSSQVAEQKKL